MLSLYVLAVLSAVVCSAIACWSGVIVFGVLALAVCLRHEALALLRARASRRRLARAAATA